MLTFLPTPPPQSTPVFRLFAGACRTTTFVACLATVWLHASRSRLQAQEVTQQKRPNIIFILADDLGYSELGCYGNGFNETPHLDHLAAQGMRFTQAYAAAPVCSPYRAALLTGQHPARINLLDYLRPNSANALSTEHATLAEQLQESGYKTGMIGKWHLTGYEYHDAEFEIKPRDHGFEWDIAREVKGVGNGANFWPYVFRTQPIRWLDIPQNRLGKDEFLVDRMNHEAVDFIERNRQHPFFLYLSHYAPHSILHGKPKLVDKYRRKHVPGKSTRERCYLCQDQGHPGDSLNHWAGSHNPHLAAMLESIDDGVGLITQKLTELGIADNTIIVFSSDNGGETNVTSNAPLRGGKSELYEGGIRVPMIARWPLVIPAGTVSQVPTVNVDFYPTLLEATNTPAAAQHTLDGVSILPTLRDPQTSPKRNTFYWHYPLDRPHFLGGVSAGAIREGDWKLIEFFATGKHELYSLARSPSETHDVAADNPELVQRLSKKLESWRGTVGARTPSPPLLTTARNLYFGDHFSSGKASDRWWFSPDWRAADGILQRADKGTDTTRIFARDLEFKDALVRFDFRLQGAQDLRLVTGAAGHYNAVIHIRPDHFYIQTAKDDRGPYFTYRHGECAYAFEPDRWYTLTVEFIGDRLVAHIDREHCVYAQHPILEQQRTYFAFQVDKNPASFDNVQIFTVGKHSHHDDSVERIKALQGQHPVAHSAQEAYAIQKTNAHEWLYQRQPEYRKLVARVAELDQQRRTDFPAAHASLKSLRKAVLGKRKEHLQTDAKYKELLHATHRAHRAIDDYLYSLQPGSKELPDSKRRHELERLRRLHAKDAQHVDLIGKSNLAQQQLEQTYPELFVSDEQLKAKITQARQALKGNEAYEALNKKRAAAYSEQQDYLFANDAKLAELKERLDADSQD